MAFQIIAPSLLGKNKFTRDENLLNVWTTGIRETCRESAQINTKKE
jgi:hypothetical protein